MSKLKLAVALMSITALIIIGLAVYVLTHTGGISLSQGIILVSVAVIGLLLVMSAIIILVKSLTAKK
jgi:hypothetical protein